MRYENVFIDLSSEFMLKYSHKSQDLWTCKQNAFISDFYPVQQHAALLSRSIPVGLCAHLTQVFTGLVNCRNESSLGSEKRYRPETFIRCCWRFLVSTFFWSWTRLLLCILNVIYLCSTLIQPAQTIPHHPATQKLVSRTETSHFKKRLVATLQEQDTWTFLSSP